MESDLSSYTSTLQSTNIRKLFSQDILSNIPVGHWRNLSSWLLEIDFFSDDSDMLLSSLSLFHSFLTKVRITREEYHIYLCACCYLSMSTYYDKEKWELNSWARAGPFKLSQLEEAVKYVVTVTEGKLRYPTPIDILQELKDEIGLTVFDAQLLCLALYCCDPKYIILDQEIVAKAGCYMLLNINRESELLEMINNDLCFYLQQEKHKRFESFRSILTVPPDEYESIEIITTEATERRKLLPVTPQYKNIQKIGQGTFGTVTLRERNNKKVAVKTQYTEENDVMYIELHVLATMRSENIINMIDFHFTQDALNIELEPGSSLRSILYNVSYKQRVSYEYEKWEKTYVSCQIKSTIPLLQKRRWMNEICRGIEYLHSFGIIHRDIKIENIIIVNNIAKIADFGSCYLNCLSENDSITKINKVYTLPYRPVELLYNSWIKGRVIIYSFSADVWATGVTILELEMGFPPFMPYLVSEATFTEGRKGKNNYPISNTIVISELEKLGKEQVMWCMAMILGSPYEEYDQFPYRYYQGTRLDCISDNEVRKPILSMLHYLPNRRLKMNEVRF